MTVRIRFDWVDSLPSPDLLACHSMAKLEIKVGREIVTTVADYRRRTVRNRIVVPLFSVAEWLVCNWWHIFHEIEDTGEQKPGFASRHDLAFASDGFVLPSLTMVPVAETVELRWRRRVAPYARVEFVNEGSVRVDRGALEAEFRKLIDAVLKRLRERGADPTMLDTEWAAVNVLDPDEREFSRAAALVGADPFDVTPSLADALISFWSDAGPSLREEALAAADADSLPEVSAWLAEQLPKLEGERSPERIDIPRTLSRDGVSFGFLTRRRDDWPNIRRDLPIVSDARPSERGYTLARSARAGLQAGDRRIDFDSPDFPAFARADARPTVRRIHGLVAADSPACVTVPRSEPATRFLTAQALGDYLDRSTSGPGILGTLATDRQAVSRAFAAEFLAPAEGLRERLRGASVVEAEGVDDLAAEFGVSSAVIHRQIDNHGLAEVAAW